MIWNPKWPFRSREHALAHEQAYLVLHATGMPKTHFPGDPE